MHSRYHGSTRNYKIIDIVLLLLGLYYATKTCSVFNALVMTSICLLVLTVLELLIILNFFVRNCSFRLMTLSEELSSNHYSSAFILRIFVGIGTTHVLRSRAENLENNCEILRFCLGLVCFSTWWSIFIVSPSKHLVPQRRTLHVEIFLFLRTISFPSFILLIYFLKRLQIKQSSVNKLISKTLFFVRH